MATLMRFLEAGSGCRTFDVVNEELRITDMNAIRLNRRTFKRCLEYLEIVSVEAL
jgi:hypothetical protein